MVAAPTRGYESTCAAVHQLHRRRSSIEIPADGCCSELLADLNGTHPSKGINADDAGELLPAGELWNGASYKGLNLLIRLWSKPIIDFPTWRKHLSDEFVRSCILSMKLWSLGDVISLVIIVVSYASLGNHKDWLHCCGFYSIDKDVVDKEVRTDET